MIQRATWSLRADDPKTPLGWLFGVDRYRGVPLYPVLAGAVVLSTLLAKGGEAWLPLGVGEGSGTFLRMLPTLFVVSALRRDRQESLAPDPAPGHIHNGSVRVELGERVLGTDGGMVAFNDGWLLFDGGRTSFALSRSDVDRSRRIGDERRLELTSGHRLRISGTGRFAVDYDLWYGEPAVTGLSRLPTTDVHPRQRVRAAAYLQLASAGLMGLGIGGIVIGGLPRAILTLLVFSGLFALAARFAQRVRLT